MSGVLVASSVNPLLNTLDHTSIAPEIRGKEKKLWDSQKFQKGYHDAQVNKYKIQARCTRIASRDPFST